MPKEAVDITSRLEITPRPEAVQEVLLIAGDDEGGNAEVGDPILVDDKSTIEDEFDGDLEDALKNALDEGVPELYGYKAPLDGDTPSYPGDIDTDQVEDDFLDVEDLGLISFVGIDPVAESGEPFESILDISHTYGSVVVADTSYEDNSGSWELDSEYKDMNLCLVAHEFDDDAVIGNIVGALATVEVNDKLKWKPIRELDIYDWDGTEYTVSEINDIEDLHINALFERRGDVVFSNGFTTTEDEGYKWLDIVRGKYYMKRLLKRSLENLIAETHIPYNSEGIQKVESRIDTACRGLEDAGFIYDYDIYMPSINEISAEDRQNRVLSDETPIEVLVDVPGHIQRLVIELVLQL